MLLSFLLGFLALLFIGGLIIVGFYIITRKEKILHAWSDFWEQTTGKLARTYYADEELEGKYKYLVQCNAGMVNLLGLSPEKKSLTIKDDIDAWQQQYIRDLLGCDLLIDSAPYMFLYSDKPIYYFPQWIRYPLSQCPPCMASVGGSIVYWAVIVLQSDIFAWTGLAWQPYFVFWVFFCFALAAVNKILTNYLGL